MWGGKQYINSGMSNNLTNLKQTSQISGAEGGVDKNSSILGCYIVRAALPTFRETVMLIYSGIAWLWIWGHHAPTESSVTIYQLKRCNVTENFNILKKNTSCAILLLLLLYRGARDSSVGITTRYGLDGPGIESRWGRDFPHPSRPALGPIQPPIQWVPSLSWG